MKLLKNIITIYQDEGANNLIIRQSIYKLYFILTVFFGAFLLLIAILFWTSFSVDTGGFFVMPFVLGFLFVITQLLIWGFLIGFLIRYFYTLYVITDTNIMKVTYSLNFKEKIDIADLYRVLSINASQSGFLPIMCNYGDITLHLQNDTIHKLKYVPEPKRILKKIEELKEQLIEQRLDDDEEILDT